MDDGTAGGERVSGISQQDAFDMLARRLEHARREHPVFAINEVDALRVILSEFEELCAAVRSEGRGRVIDEGLDLCVVSLRLVMGEVDD